MAAVAESERSELFIIAISKLVNDFDNHVLDLDFISISDKNSVVISKKNHAYYPPEFASEFQKIDEGLINTKEFCELNVTLKPLRVIISIETFKASLQLHHRELNSISNSFWFNDNDNLWHLSEGLLEMLEKVREVDDGNYQICSGITKEELGSQSYSTYLNCLKYPYVKYVSNNCEGIFLRYNYTKRHSPTYLNLPRCQYCKQWIFSSRKAQKRKAEKELQKGPAKIPRTDCRSHYAISKLTTKSRKKRISNIRINRNNLCRSLKLLKHKYAKLTIKIDKITQTTDGMESKNTKKRETVEKTIAKGGKR